MNNNTILKSNQEQIVASLIDSLNQIRINNLAEQLSKQAGDFESAIKSLTEAEAKILNGVINNGKGLGGPKGMHGFIAEIAECGVSNARRQILGKSANVVYKGDNGIADLTRDNLDLQLKFHEDKFSLDAIKDHMIKYPNFLENGKYQISKDEYEILIRLYKMPASEAGKLSMNADGCSYRQWKNVHKFFENNDIKIKDIEPSKLDYADVQKETYKATIDNEKKSINETNDERNSKIYDDNKASIEEGAKAAVFSAAIEGATTLALEIRKKHKEGKELADFTKDDWNDVLSQAGKGTIKGGVRGISIYTLSNMIPAVDVGNNLAALQIYSRKASVTASALTTAAFAVAEQLHLLRKGEISKTDFLWNAEVVCLDVSISALSSLLGQAIIPVPILGAVIGNTVGTMLYQMAKENFTAAEQKTMDSYLMRQKIVDKELAERYESYIETLKSSVSAYMMILEDAFSPDITVALNGSVQLALACGVPTDELLDTQDKIESYFLD